jgi:hypothetical protein
MGELPRERLPGLPDMNYILGCCIASALTLAFGEGASSVKGQDLRIIGVTRLENGQIQVSASGSSPNPVDLQASSDLSSWSTIQTLSANHGSLVFTDSMSAGERIYRLHTTPAPTQLADLADSPNRVFEAPEGFNTIQYAPNGTLGFIAWRDRDLILRERSANGTWSEQTVDSLGNVFKMLLVFDFSGPREDYRFQPSSALAYDSASRPHIFQVNGKSIIHYTRNGNGAWAEAERIGDPYANADLSVLEAAIGPNDVIHFTALCAGSPANLAYGSNRSGQWSWSSIASVTSAALTYWAPPFAARWLSMAIDSRNNAHLAFRTSMDLTTDAFGHPRAYSLLKYASNVSGQWQTALVLAPFDNSGEAANGASIAIGSDDKPRIASWFDERGDGGSAQESRLYYHQLNGDGSWVSSVVATAPDGYSAGDGPKGTGFSPQLRFDNRGNAHILFLDHAGEHFGGIGQQEYAGNLRHGWWNGSGWSFETLARQTSPLLQEIVYPTFALNGGELAVTYLQRDTQWNLTSYPPLSNSTYYFRFLTGSIQ